MPRLTEHTPDITRIPKSLSSLDWQPMEVGEETQWCDGDVLLAAVPICDPKRTKWWYSFSVVTIRRVYVEHFEMEEAEMPWGWEFSDMDFWVKIE